MTPLKFHPEADDEMMNAASHYEREERGLGKRFLASVQDASIRIQTNPRAYHAIENTVRRCLVRTFPFALLFRIQSNSLEIIAVMHLHRHPDYWKKRLDG